LGGDLIAFKGIVAIDVKKVNTHTEFRLGDGVVGNSGFGKGELLVTLQNTVGLSEGNIGENLDSENTASFWFS
jgi:ABC-type phosphate/phosphonate transport system ATPase subunit